MLCVVRLCVPPLSSISRSTDGKSAASFTRPPIKKETTDRPCLERHRADRGNHHFCEEGAGTCFHHPKVFWRLSDMTSNIPSIFLVGTRETLQRGAWVNLTGVFTHEVCFEVSPSPPLGDVLFLPQQDLGRWLCAQIPFMFCVLRRECTSWSPSNVITFFSWTR